MMGMEAELLADTEHATVLRQDHSGDPVHLLIAADGDELMEDLGTQSAPLERVADQEGKLGLVGAKQEVQPPHGDDLVFPGLRVLVVSHEHHLTVVIDEAGPSQPVVGDAPAQLQGLEEAQVDGVLGELLVELHHQRLVLGADRANRDGQTAFACKRGDVLGGIRADGGARQLVRSDFRPVQDHAGVQRDQPLGRGEHRINVDLLDPRQLDHQPAEPDQQPLQRAQIDGTATADSLQGSGRSACPPSSAAPASCSVAAGPARGPCTVRSAVRPRRTGAPGRTADQDGNRCMIS